jgi:hypothetical protein
MKNVLLVIAAFIAFVAARAQNISHYKLDAVIYSPECYMSDGDYMKTAYSYDQHGKLTSHANLSSADGEEWDTLIHENKYEYTYDALGNILSERELSSYYREFGQGIIWHEDAKTEYLHNEKGDLVAVTEYMPDDDYDAPEKWEPVRHITYSWMNNGKTVIYKLNVDWDYENKQWVESSFSIHSQTIDENNRLVEVFEAQNIEDTNYISAARSVRTYLNNTDLLTDYIYVKFGNMVKWHEYKKTDYEYDEHENLVQAIETTFDLMTGQANESETIEKHTYRYDEKGKMTSDIIFLPSYTDDKWIPRERYVYEYNENDSVTVESYYELDQYYFEETGSVDSLYLIRQEFFNYDDHGNRIEHIIKVYYEYNQSLADAARTVYSYDYNINRSNFITQFRSLKPPEILFSSSTWKQLTDQLLFNDRVLIEETTYEMYDAIENEPGKTEIGWLNPCTQKYIYSKLE